MADVQGPLPSPTATESDQSPPPTVGKSMCLLLDRRETALTESPSPTKLSPKTSTAKLLETRSLSILRAFNARDIAAPYTLHSTHDFTFVHENHHGTASTFSKSQAMFMMKHIILRNIEHMAEVMSSAVEVDEEKGSAVVWVGMRIHDRPDGFMPGTEKVTCFFWRRVEGFGGERRWMWWKHLCLSARMPMPR